MKLALLLLVCVLALHNGKGAPANAVYKFVRCSPSGGQANCVTQQTAEMPWSPDLPAKLPASTAQTLEADAVEDEGPLREEEMAEEEEEEAEEEEEEEKEEEDDEEEEGWEESEAEEEDGWENEDEDDEEGWEESEAGGEEDWEGEGKVPVVGEEGEEGESPVRPSEEGSGGHEGSADSSIPFGDVGSGASWTEEVADVVGESRPAETQEKPEEQELREQHLLRP